MLGNKHEDTGSEDDLKDEKKETPKSNGGLNHSKTLPRLKSAEKTTSLLSGKKFKQ
jgi:hypothetical protein